MSAPPPCRADAPGCPPNVVLRSKVKSSRGPFVSQSFPSSITNKAWWWPRSLLKSLTSSEEHLWYFLQEGKSRGRGSSDGGRRQWRPFAEPTPGIFAVGVGQPRRYLSHHHEKPLRLITYCSLSRKPFALSSCFFQNLMSQKATVNSYIALQSPSSSLSCYSITVGGRWLGPRPPSLLLGSFLHCDVTHLSEVLLPYKI